MYIYIQHIYKIYSTKKRKLSCVHVDIHVFSLALKRDAVFLYLKVTNQIKASPRRRNRPPSFASFASSAAFCTLAPGSGVPSSVSGSLVGSGRPKYLVISDMLGCQNWRNLMIHLCSYICAYMT